MSPGDKLRMLRTELGLSQNCIAEFLLMTQSGWSNCERGMRKLSLKKCYKLISLAKIKGVDISLEYLRPDE